MSKCAQLIDENGKGTKDVILLLSVDEAASLSKLIDKAVEKKVFNAKRWQKKLYQNLIVRR